MTPQEWERVSELFEQALAQPKDVRLQFLNGLMGETLEIVQQVRALLAEHDNAEHALLDAPTGRVAQELAPDTHAPTTPERIGAYRIVREIGHGGMGIVYLAQRDDGQFEQDVALKVLRRGIDSHEVRQRFVFERQLLAKLRHPGIATLLDGGIDDDGRPFLVLEYVDGVALLEYCDMHALSIDQRLRLFIRICDTVQHAHQALIVHRDLKPSNILVTNDGEPRLLDFGIAKLLDVGAMPSDAPDTRAGSSLLTPEYGAPEQLRGDSVTTATDVYALGVILYELVCGRRPYEFTSRSVVAIYEALVKTVPQRPSARVQRTPTTIRALAQQRSTTPPRLVRRLRGDLDLIAMTALAKEASRRYGSAGALADDVRRYLDGRPIQARGDRLGYRFAKFLRRHVVAASAVVLVALSVIGGLAAAAWQGRIAAREAAKADAVSTFLLDMLQSANPNEAEGRDLTVRELVDAAAARLDEPGDGSIDDPQVEATIRATLGGTLRALGKYDAAAAQLRRALALSEQALTTTHPHTLQIKSDLGAAHFDARRTDQAESLYREVLDTATRALGKDHPIVLEARVRYGGIYFRRGELAEAEGLLSESVAANKRVLGPEHPSTLSAMGNLAASIARQGRLEEAAVLLNDALAAIRRVHGDKDRMTLVTMDNLANLHLALDNKDEAVAFNEQSVAIRQEVLDPNHPELLESLGRLAGAYHNAERFDESRQLFETVIPAMNQYLGPRHMHTLVARGNQALLRADMGEPGAALAVLQGVVAELSETLGDAHPMTTAMRQEMLAINP